MAEHAKFVRGLLDPTEDALINMSNNFGKQFDRLTKESIELNDSISGLTKKSIAATATGGLFNYSIQSIIVQLLGDHMLREANHYLRLLHIFNNEL